MVFYAFTSAKRVGLNFVENLPIEKFVVKFMTLDMLIINRNVIDAHFSSPELKAHAFVRALTFSKIFSETVWPMKSKFYGGPSWVVGTKM